MPIDKKPHNLLNSKKKKESKPQIPFMPTGKHVDEWLDTPTMLVENHDKIAYAKFVLEFYRMPAFKQTEYKQWIQPFELYCTYNGIRYKVCGASRLGSIFLTTDFSKPMGMGYDNSITVDKCSDWSENP